MRNGRQFAPLLDHLVEGEFRRVLQFADQLVLYGVREEKNAASAALRIRILAGPDGKQVRQTVAAEVTRQFSAHLDLQPFYDLAAADPVLRHLIVHFCGMRIPQAPNVFESLISAIIEQQVNLSFAHQVKEALIAAYGRSVDYEGRRYRAFPEPGALAVTSPGELRRLQVSGPKARYIIAVSRLALDGTLDMEGLRQAPPRLAHQELLKHKGVGPWTAHYVGLRALGHLDCLPAADVGLQKAVSYFYGLRKKVTPERLERLARPWKGWRSYATFYLWLTYWETPDWKRQLLDAVRAGRRRLNNRRLDRRIIGPLDH